MDYYECLKKEYQIKDCTLALMQRAEQDICPHFTQIDKVCAANQLKVMQAFSEYRVSEQHLGQTTGYGYDDIGRDTLDRIYARVFGAEAALVRHSIVSGTHALSTCLFGVLRPGDVMLSVTGRPYDTLEEVIGLRGNGNGSLAEWGVSYKEVALLEDGSPDLQAIQSALTPEVKLVEIQRSKGYDWRKSLQVADIEKIVACVKAANPDIICMVDNCYGEFVETREPTERRSGFDGGFLDKEPGRRFGPDGSIYCGKGRFN